MPNPTVADIIGQARVDLNDTDAELYRYATADLLAHLNYSLYTIRRVRPDFFYGVSTTVQYDATDIDGLTEFVFPQFVDPCAKYVAGRAELRDDEFAEDGRANQLMQMFLAAVTGAL